MHVLGRKTDSDCEFLGWQTNKRSQLPHTVLAVRLLTAAPSSLVSAVHQVKIQKKKARWGFCQFMKKNNNCSLFRSEIKILNSVPLTHRVVCNDKLFYSMTEESFQTKQSNTDWLFLFQWDEKINLHRYRMYYHSRLTWSFFCRAQSQFSSGRTSAPVCRDVKQWQVFWLSNQLTTRLMLTVLLSLVDCCAVAYSASFIPASHNKHVIY